MQQQTRTSDFCKLLKGYTLFVFSLFSLKLLQIGIYTVVIKV